jgi:hypothetical protein
MAPTLHVDLERKMRLAKLTSEVQEFEIRNYFLMENIENGEFPMLLDTANNIEALYNSIIPKVGELEDILARTEPEQLTDEIARFLNANANDIGEPGKQRILAAINRMGGVAAAVTRTRMDLERFREAHHNLQALLTANTRPPLPVITEMRSRDAAACGIAIALLALGIAECLPCGIAGATLGARACLGREDA